jgi:hypothetical protein
VELLRKYAPGKCKEAPKAFERWNSSINQEEMIKASKVRRKVMERHDQGRSQRFHAPRALGAAAPTHAALEIPGSPQSAENIASTSSKHEGSQRPSELPGTKKRKKKTKAHRQVRNWLHSELHSRLHTPLRLWEAFEKNLKTLSRRKSIMPQRSRKRKNK